MAITYQLGSKLYINLTNRCTNDCKFCVRQFKDGLGGYKLWLEEEPTAGEVIDDIIRAEDYSELVFCGFGEPLMRLEVVIEVAKWVQNNQPQIPVRVNTNGLANLVHGRNILPKLGEVIDAISISLNASNAETYQEVSQSEYGKEAFGAVIKFIKKAQEYIPEVQVSVVDYEGVNLEESQKTAEKLGVKLKVR
jgi:TatD family-associated radical SAM protein